MAPQSSATANKTYRRPLGPITAINLPILLRVKNLKGMRTHLKVVMILLALCSSILSCKQPNKEQYISLLFNDLKSVQIDSLRNVGAFWRNSQLLVLRKYNDLSYDISGYQLLLMRISDDSIGFKYDKRLIPLDSIYNFLSIDTLGLTEERIRYIFEFMEAKNILSIHNRNDLNAILFTIDTIGFYYVIYNKYFNDRPWIKSHIRSLEDKWWALRNFVSVKLV